MHEPSGDDHTLVIGQGYVGLPLAVAAHRAGFTVTGVDTDSARVSQISSGKSPFPDVKSSELRNALRSGTYTVQTDYADLTKFDFAIITVPTPLSNGRPDLQFIESAGASLGALISRGSTVILESTTYPGTTEELLLPLLEKGSGLRAGHDFFLGYSPERIDPGNQVWNLMNTPKVISGVNESSLASVENFYSTVGIPVVPVRGTREAELTKLLENTFRHVNIALVNELAMFSSALGVNIWDAIEAASTKPFGFMKFTPGPGVGGHCLPIDPSYLSWAIRKKAESTFRFVELANSVNQMMPSFVFERVKGILDEAKVEISSARILLYGLSYKERTADTRESPSIFLAEMLHKAGAHVFGLDEFVADFMWPSFISRDLALEGHFDLGIVMTPHSRSVAESLVRRCVAILDTRNVIAGEGVFRL